MKKLTGILIALSFLISASSFTLKDETVSAKVKTAFAKTFATASDVNWKKLEGFYLANFKVNNQDFSVAYNEDGELISAARSITLSELPLNVALELQNKYPKYTIANDVTELTEDGFNSYYIKGENSKNIVTIKANSSGEMGIERRTKK